MLSRIKEKASYYLRYNYLFHRYLKVLMSTSQQDVELQKNALFNKVFKQALRSKFYKKLYSEFGVNVTSIKGVQDIGNLPIIDKSLIKDSVDQLWVGLSPKVRAYTSGTSGSPLVVYRSLESIIIEQSYVWAYRHSKGFFLGEALISLRGHLDSRISSKFDRTHNTLFLSSYMISAETATHYYNLISSFKPKAIEAYPSSVYELALLFFERNLVLDIPFVFTSSEPLLDYQRTLIESVFNCKIYDWYGNAERTIALQQERDRRYYEPPFYSVNEYCSGGLITTSLTNFNFPLIRYRVDDVLEDVRLSPVFSVKSVSGRSDDVVVLENGVKVGRLDHVFKNVNGVRYAQIIQEVDYSITVLLDCDPSFSAIEEGVVRNNFSKYLGAACRVTFVYSKVDDFVTSRSGKFRFVVNRLIHKD